LNAMSFSETELHPYILADNEWKIIELLVEVLLPFKDVTTFMSSSEYPTLSMVISVYYLLLESLEEARKKDDMPQWLIQGCESASGKLLEYCQRTSVLHIVSVVLDPQFKLQYFVELRWPSQLINQIRDM
ncbi:24521_t:CDS:2, partial [Cetraspora pellucida]